MKILYMGKELQPRTKGKYSTKGKAARAWAYFYKLFLIETGTLIVGASLIAVGMQVAATPVVKAEEPTIIVQKADMTILHRIADCESGNGKAGSANQYSKDGQVVIHANNNGTYDIGKFQINSIHRATATKLGFDLFTEEGNVGFAEYMWSHNGTGDWDSSARCWRR